MALWTLCVSQTQSDLLADGLLLVTLRFDFVSVFRDSRAFHEIQRNGVVISFLLGDSGCQVLNLFVRGSCIV